MGGHGGRIARRERKVKREERRVEMQRNRVSPNTKRTPVLGAVSGRSRFWCFFFNFSFNFSLRLRYPPRQKQPHSKEMTQNVPSTCFL